jgi:uncharacterized protein involved in exopolysaccharide biosynthesis
MEMAIITALSTIIGAVISGAVSLVVAGKQHDKTIALIEYRLKELEKKQDVHNNLITRMTAVETKINMYHGKEVANGAK